MSHEKLIMFDFDGVIADSLDEQSAAFEDTLRANGLHELANRSPFSTSRRRTGSRRWPGQASPTAW